MLQLCPASSSDLANRIAEVDRVWSLYYEAFRFWAELPDHHPGESEAERRRDVADAAIEELETVIWSQPVRDWSDAVVRARLAQHRQRRVESEGCRRHDEAERQMIESVIALAAVPPLPPSPCELSSVGRVVTVLGGRQAFAHWTGIAAEEIDRWIERDSIPTDWRSKVASEVQRRNHRLAITLITATA